MFSIDKELLVSCLEGSLSEMRRCVNLGANIHMTVERADIHAVTPCIDNSYSAEGECFTLLYALVKACTAASPAHFADCLVFLIDMGLPVDVTCGGETPLSGAVASGNIEFARLLLYASADVDYRSFGMTPLHTACENGLTDVASLLIDFGADVNTISFSERFRGSSPVTIAAEMSHCETVRLLVFHGCDVDSVTTYNLRAAVYFAASNGNMDMLKVLIDDGADLFQMGRDGARAADIARENGHLEIVAYIGACHALPDGSAVHHPLLRWETMLSISPALSVQMQALLRGVNNNPKRFLRAVAKSLHEPDGALSLDSVLTEVLHDETRMGTVFAKLLCGNCLSYKPEKSCGACMRTKYCGKACQTAHYPMHRHNCKL